MTSRRELLILLGGLPLAARAQRPARTFHIAVLWPMPESDRGPYRTALSERLAEFGFVERRNLTTLSHTTNGTALRAATMAELSALKLDAIFSLTNLTTESVKGMNLSTPAVFARVVDPVLQGIVKDYAHPGGSLTGVSVPFADLAIKRLQLLHELLPSARRLVLIGQLTTGYVQLAVKRLQEVAPQLGVELSVHDYYSWPFNVEESLRAGARGVLILEVLAWWGGSRYRGAEAVRLTTKYRVPVIFAESEMVEQGGLISYGTNLVGDVRRAAELLAKVLRGAKPSDVAVEQTANFELALNLKTARSIGLAIPQSILARADRLIE
jgi:putative ABC transport system substrate-binding protein